MSHYDPNQPRDDIGRWSTLAGLMHSSGGFTSFANGVVPKSGFAVGVASKDGKDHRTLPHGSTDAAAIEAFAKDFQAELGMPNRGIGGWSNSDPADGDVRDALDIVEVHNTLDDALNAAQKAGQDAIYDLGTHRTIPVPQYRVYKDAQGWRFDWPDGRPHEMHYPSKRAAKDAITAMTHELSIFTPNFEGEYDLSFKDGQLAYWKQILPQKVIHYTAKDGSRRTLDFNKQYLDDLAHNAAVDSVGFLLANVDNQHTMDPERFRGRVSEFAVREDEPNPDHNGLWGKIVFPSREAAKAVLDNPDLGVSARIREDIPKSDGSTVARGIVHVLGTLDPQVSGMAGWQPTDLSNDGPNLLDLTAETYEDGTMAENEKALDEYTEAEIEAMDDDALNAYLARAAEEFAGILDEDEDELLDEDDETQTETERVAEMALSTELRGEIDLANSRAVRALTKAAQAEWDKMRADYMHAGVPADSLDLAEPIFNRPTEFVVDLSNEGGESINVGEIVAKLLDAQKGTIDLSTEVGHGGTFKSGDGEDPDAENLAIWDTQFNGS